MHAAAAFFFSHPLWIWLAIAAVLLAAEAASGSGWLLWPSAAAVLTGIANLALPLSTAAAVAIFGTLTIVATILGRRALRKRAAGADINDSLARLVGRRGEAASTFEQHRGRVFVDGKEWAAELEGGEAVRPGEAVEVTGVIGGARLRVRRAAT